MHLFSLRFWLAIFPLCLATETVCAQYAAWGDGQTATESNNPYEPVQPLPPTDVFPPKYPLYEPVDPTAAVTRTAAVIPPELDEMPYDMQMEEGLTLNEDEIFSSRPVLATSKPGILQAVTTDSTWIAGSGDNIGMTDVLGTITLGFPAPTIDSPLIVTPGFGMHFLVGPASVDAPPTLYDAFLTTRYIRPINDRWGVILSGTAGYYSDFQQQNSDAFRPSAMAIATYNWNKNWQFLGGVVWLNRDDFNILPIAGVVWTGERRKLELTFPRPRYSQLWDYGPGYEDWWYITGELGGGTWSVQRADETNDLLTISDYRAIVGFERRRDGGGKSFIEFGYVFGRQFEYRNQPFTLDMNDTVLIRSGWWF
ncbi:DUF6268 family outer membrane beta-barrel protein [Blastopirellula sp. JC732]|uniref:DUF6268 family outer membrane beta-barrel protein n=1 Tax=Blastopirellula sediminis TaxID=2894196 RepID=A0A9X1SGA9_9BACT|nr:DUF6268 family outer membrane beta-barrel protein [Blastopirellula sediminis]MCC9606692.1 DUF6268 family outer membrane beta-barrel protein [Blastopirellula sediminis]MCC9630010.1 DUF6268 family outer membrane beta-barrel protein [Blastopirellula sediminis]